MYLRCLLGVAKVFKTDVILNRVIERASGVTDCELTPKLLTLRWQIGISLHGESRPGSRTYISEPWFFIWERETIKLLGFAHRVALRSQQDDLNDNVKFSLGHHTILPSVLYSLFAYTFDKGQTAQRALMNFH